MNGFKLSIMAMAVSSLISTCSSDISPEEAQTRPVSNLRSAFGVISSSGIAQSTTSKTLEGERVSGFNTQLFNMAFTSVKADLTSEIVIDLGDSPAAQFIRKEGVPVFTYLTPKYTVRRPKAGSDDVYPIRKRVYLPDGVGSFCYGYYVILSPENGYRRSWTVTSVLDLASKSSGIDAGLWGSNLGSSDWRAVDIDDVTRGRAMAARKPFTFDHGSRMLENCYADQSTKRAWLGR